MEGKQRQNYTAGEKDLIVKLANAKQEIIECDITNKKSKQAKVEV